MIDTFDQFNVKTPSLEAVDEFTIIDGKQVKVVRAPEMKDEPDPSIHHHNNLDQPTIDLNRDVVGTILHADLSSVTSDQHHAQTHAASHTSGGADDLTGQTLSAIILTGGRMTGGTVNTSSIGTMSATGGTATNLTLVTPTVGTPTVTGGTLTNVNLVTPTIGTPSLIGGTVNPIAYQAGGTVGIDGTAIYVKTIVAGTADTWGTITFTKGIATTVS